MSLHESLSKFKKQQEKCQSTLTSIAKTAPSRPVSLKTPVVGPSTSASAKPPAPAVKFSNDTERLQHINSIRKGPVGAQIKRVIDLLLEGTGYSLVFKYGGFTREKSWCSKESDVLSILWTKQFVLHFKAPLKIKFGILRLSRLDILESWRRLTGEVDSDEICVQHTDVVSRYINLTRKALTPEQINEIVYVDINGNKGVFDSLRNNPKVRYDGRYFSYKSKHDLKDRDQLLFLVRKFPEGIAVIDLKDSYPNVMEDLQALKASGDIWLLSNFDSQEDIAYPNDPRVHNHKTVKVDDDLKQLFRSIELPRDMIDIEKDLQKNGMRPATNTARRRAMAQNDGLPGKSKDKKKRKNKEITSRTKLTNAHLPELFRK